MMDKQDVWTVLQDNGLVTGDRPQHNDNDTPWYVKTMLGFCGWLAAIFMFGFLALGINDLLDSLLGCLSVGAVMLVIAYTLLVSSKASFTEHLGLAISLAGQGLWAFAIYDLAGLSDALAWGLICLIELALAVMMPNFVHRVFSAFVSAYCLASLFAEIHMTYMAASVVMIPTAWLWLNEFHHSNKHQKHTAVAYGFTLALLLIVGTNNFLGRDLLIYDSTLRTLPWLSPWGGELLNTLVFTYVSWRLLQRYDATYSTRLLALTGTLIFCAASFQAQGLSCGLMILVLGYASSNRILLGLGIVAFLFYVSAYYYQLQITLLMKSLTLFLIGSLMLAAYWFLHRHPQSQELTDA